MEIRSANYLISSPRVELCPKPDIPEYAFIGRSNVGKSSLINMLCGRPGLAKTSSSPGKTQMINHFRIDGMLAAGEEGKGGAFYFVDLPGYGYAKRSRTQRAEWEKMIRQYLIERENLMTIFMLVDSRHEPQRGDLEFLEKLGEWEIAFNPVFTKTDKVPQRESSANMRRFIDAMRKDWEFIPRTFMTSAEKGRGRRELMSYIAELNAEFVPGGKKP